MVDSVVFYRSFFEALNDLEGDDYINLSKALFAYMFDDIEPELKGVPAGYFKLMRPNIDANKRKRQNAIKGGAVTKARAKQGQTEAKTRPSIGQEKAKVAPNVDVNVNVNDNVNDNANVNAEEIEIIKKIKALDLNTKKRLGDDVRRWLATKGNNEPTQEELNKVSLQFYRKNPDKYKNEPIPAFYRPMKFKDDE